MEAHAWHKYRSRPANHGIKLAPCRLLPNGCLMMVLVDHDWHDASEDEKKWADYIDCQQVGLYRGKLVAFDYALDIPERRVWEKEWGTRSEWYHEDIGPSDNEDEEVDY